MESKLRSSEQLAQTVGESREQIRRFIRLNELIPEILAMVDEGKIAIRPAETLSYISQPMQKSLFEIMSYLDCTPSHAQAIRLRNHFEKGELTEHVIERVLGEEKPNQRDRIVIQLESARKYIPDDVPKNKTGEYVLEALEFYQRHREKTKADRDAR